MNEDKQLLKLFGDIDSKTQSLTKLLVSFSVLLNDLAKRKRAWEKVKNDQRASSAFFKKNLSIIKGPLLNPTKSKLIKLEEDFDALASLIDQVPQVRKVQPKEKAYRDLYDNYRALQNSWEDNQENARSYKNSLVAELSINGQLHKDVSRGIEFYSQAEALSTKVTSFLGILKSLNYNAKNCLATLRRIK